MAYFRHKDHWDSVLQTGERVDFRAGERVVSLLGCVLEVQTARKGTEVRFERDWTANGICKVVLREGMAYVRLNHYRDGVLQTGQEVTFEAGESIVSLLGCTFEVELVGEDGDAVLSATQ